MPPHRSRVLIVDDDALIAFGVEMMVEEFGHAVVGPYHNLNDGLDHATHDQIDFALLDFDLGDGTDSIPIAEALQERHIPFAFVSGGDAVHIRSFIPDATVVAKPVRAAELETALA